MKNSNLSRITLYSLIIAFCFSFTNCKKKEEKQPSSDFTTDKSEYVAGQTIFLTNTSSNASSFRWTMPDGQTVKSTDASYQTNQDLGLQQLAFKLEAFSESGNKSDYTVKVIPVKNATGQLILYDGYTSYPIAISIDGVSYGNAVLPAGIPVCGQAGYSTYTLKTGSHFLTAGSPYSGNPQIFQINSNECTVLKVSF